MIRISSGLFWLCGLLFFLFLMTSFSYAVSPNGANVSVGSVQTAPSDSAESAPAQAGNVTQLDIFAYSTTQTWQGYYGNISGTIQLADANAMPLYNWSLANPQGEVYASTNLSLQWTNIQCFNFTANGTGDPASITGGSVNAGGVNLTTLESRFNIADDDVDGVNETFYLEDHEPFFTAHIAFGQNSCPSTRVYGQNGPADQQFEEVILYEPVSGSIVFTSLIESGNVIGFNDQDNDFQMLVLEDGHGSDVDATTYYFYVELE